MSHLWGLAVTPQLGVSDASPNKTLRSSSLSTCFGGWHHGMPGNPMVTLLLSLYNLWLLPLLLPLLLRLVQISIAVGRQTDHWLGRHTLHCMLLDLLLHSRLLTPLLLLLRLAKV